MNSEKLRAKLLAQRAAQREEAERRTQIHQEAKNATKIMVLLGYNFEDIFDMVTPKVSEDYLIELFRSVGYFRKRKRTSERLSAFGAPRWLDSPEDMIIDMHSDSEDDGDMDRLPKRQQVYATSIDNSVSPPPGHQGAGSPHADACPDQSRMEVSGEPSHISEHNAVEAASLPQPAHTIVSKTDEVIAPSYATGQWGGGSQDSTINYGVTEAKLGGESLQGARTALGVEDKAIQKAVQGSEAMPGQDAMQGTNSIQGIDAIQMTNAAPEPERKVPDAEVTPIEQPLNDGCANARSGDMEMKIGTGVNAGTRIGIENAGSGKEEAVDSPGTDVPRNVPAAQEPMHAESTEAEACIDVSMDYNNGEAAGQDPAVLNNAVSEPTKFSSAASGHTKSSNAASDRSVLDNAFTDHTLLSAPERSILNSGVPEPADGTAHGTLDHAIPGHNVLDHGRVDLLDHDRVSRSEHDGVHLSDPNIMEASSRDRSDSPNHDRMEASDPAALANDRGNVSDHEQVDAITEGPDTLSTMHPGLEETADVDKMDDDAPGETPAEASTGDHEMIAAVGRVAEVDQEAAAVEHAENDLLETARRAAHDKAANAAVTVDDLRVQTERVQAQIQEIQDRKLRLAELRLNAKLREIAVKRTKLIQTRQSVNVTAAAKKVARLESQLVEAKALMIQAAQRLKQIDQEGKELDKEEADLKKRYLEDDGVGKSQVGAGPSTIIHASPETAEQSGKDSPGDVEAPPKKVYIPPTVETSPLRMFSSFRMCPSLKPRFWFAPTFNSRFVRDLQNRVLCNSELKRGECRKKDCQDVHLAEFLVSGEVICKYMASRELDDPDFRAGLIDAVRTHLKSPEVPVENLAATIIGFRRKCDPTQFLDWGEVKKPF